MRKWLLGGACAVLLCLCTLVSAVAATAEGPVEPPEVTLPPAADAEEELPSGPEVSNALARTLKEQRLREEELQSPRMIEARDLSRFAYSDLDSFSESASLLRSTFADQLAALNQDPGRFLSDAELEQRLGPTAARVSDEGEHALLEAGVPVQTREDDGTLGKVDLALTDSGDSFAPVNPLVDFEISAEPQDGIKFATSAGDLEIRPAVEGGSQGTKYGNQNAFFPDIAEDRDLLVAPVARGIETFDQLRSANSPERLRYELGLPPDSILTSDEMGGANIVQGDDVLVHISFPTAVDAQGSSVPVDLEIDGDAIILKVDHRDRSVAYPLLVDPTYELAESWYWYGGAHLGALSDGTWQWGSNVGWIHGSTSCIYACWGSGRGLFVSTPSGTFAGDQFGQWTYTPPGTTTRVTGADLNPFWRSNHNCNANQYPQPHDYAGIWSPDTQGGWDIFRPDHANDFGQVKLSAVGRVLVVGLGTGPGGSNSCWRDIMLGGASVWINDPDNPTWNGAPSVSTAWTHNTMLPISGSASDPGLGVKYFDLYTTDGSGSAVTKIGNSVHPCSGLKASPCPGSWSTQITNYSPASLPTGVNVLALRASDPLWEVHYAGQPVFLKVDHTAPVIKTSGELLSPNPIKYHLEVDAEDGSSASLATSQSGMKKLEFFLDDQYQGAWPKENPGNCVNVQEGLDLGSCKFEGIDVDLPRVLEGPHTLKIVASDSYGHKTTKVHNLNLPKDVTAPELTVSGQLKTAPGSWVAANVNSVTIEAKDVETGATEATVFVDGEEVVAPATQECRFGGCSLNQSFSVDLFGYEEGLHTIKAVARDGAGNSTQSSWTVSVDPHQPKLDLTATPSIPSGWTPQLTGLAIDFSALDATAAGNGSGVAKVEAVVPIGGSTSIQTLYSSACKGTAESPCQQEAVGSKPISLFPVITQGTVQMPIKAYDLAGNVSTQTLTLKIDRTAPTVKATGPLVEAPVGTLVGGSSKLDLTITDTGSGVKTMELLLDGNVEETMTLEEIEADGGTQTCSGAPTVCTLTYSFVPEIGHNLASGNHALVIRATDRTDRTGSLSKEVTLDAKPPKLDITTTPSIPSGWTPQLANLSVGFTALDIAAGGNGSGITKVEALVPTTFNPAYPQTLYSSACKGTAESPCQQEAAGSKAITFFPIIAQGTVQMPIKAYDLAGNVSTLTLTLRVDREGPTVKATGPLVETPVGTLVGGASKLDLTVTDTGSGVGSVELLLDGNVEETMTLEEIEADGGEQTCSGTGTVCTLTYSFVPEIGHDLASGNHTLVIRAKDLAERTGSLSKEVTLDTKAPKLDLTTTPSVPSGWTPQLTGLAMNFSSLDTTAGGNGSGITKVEAIPPILASGSPSPQTLYSSSCKGTAESPCPQEASGTKNLEPFFVITQGIAQVPLKVYDLAGNVSTQTLTLKIDRTAPTVKATGPLVETPVGTLVGGASKLDLTVTDTGSGVGSVELLLDGNVEETMTLEEIEADGGTQTCSGTTRVCTLTYSFVPEIGHNLASGNHTLVIRAKDLAERTGSLSKEVTLDTAGPEVDLSGLLAESAGKELETAEADLKVVATDLSSTYASGIKWIVIAVDGEQVAALDSCNAAPCATTGELSYIYKETDWGTGPHEVEILVTDWVGNTIERRLWVNASITAVAPECPTGPQEIVEPAGVVTPTEASQLLLAAVPPAVAPSEPSEGESVESPFDPSVAEEGQHSINEQGIDIVGTPTGGGIEDAPAGSFTVGQALCMQSLQRTGATDAPIEVAGGDAVLYANTAPETDTLVRPAAFGTTIVQHRRGPAAPSGFSWEVKLGQGEELRKLANGSVVVVRSGVNVDEVEAPPGVPELDPGSIPDVQAQQLRAGANLAEANNAIEGEVVAVIAAPQAVLSNGSTAPALLQISGGSIVTATLPPNVVANTTAMIIEANTAPDPDAMCAHSFESSPNLYDVGCSEAEDADAEPDPSGTEHLSMFDLNLAGQTERGDYFAGLNSAPPGSASASNTQDSKWCKSGYPRQIYCGFFYDDKVFATRVEVGMFNVPSDGTKANAFKHAVWVSAMVNSDPPDSEAISFALNHEKGQQTSSLRKVRYKSSMDVLNNWTAYRFSHFGGPKDDMQACQYWVSKVGPALLMPFNENPIAWANRVGFQHHNLVYRHKYEKKVRVHLVLQDCNAGLARGIYFGAGGGYE